MWNVQFLSTITCALVCVIIKITITTRNVFPLQIISKISKSQVNLYSIERRPDKHIKIENR